MIANYLWLAASFPDWLRFRRATKNVEETQRRLLGTRELPPPNTDIPTPKERVLLFEPTGGTHGTKLIPMTASLKREFRRGVAAWTADLFLRRPRLLNGPAYWAISPRTPPQDKDGIPVGFEQDTDYLGSRLLESVMAVKKPEPFWESTARQLLQAENLRIISVWSPTFLTILLQRIREHWVDEGRLKGLREAPARTWWPGLGLVSCWADGPSARYAAQLADEFPGVELQPKGLLATEAIVSFPFAGTHPLAITSHFLEFEEPDGTLRLAHQLKQGATYSVLVTTGGGLRRYRLGDRVRVTGHLNECPTIRFLGREGGLQDRFGEKLHPAHVEEALADVPARFLLVAYEPPGYILFVESDGDLQQLGATLEAKLQENFHYAHCRRLGQLAPLRVFRVTHDGAATYHRERAARGQRLGDVKPSLLDPGEDWSTCLPGHFLDCQGQAGKDTLL